MSLIMDALKRTQQLRSKDSKETPFFKNPPAKNKKSPGSSGKRWAVIGAVLASLVIAVFVFLKPASLPLIPKPGRAVALIEKKAPLPVAEKKPQEPLKEIASLPKEQSPSLQEDKGISGPKPAEDVKKEEPIKKQVGEENKVEKVTLSPPWSEGRDLSSARVQAQGSGVDPERPRPPLSKRQGLSAVEQVKPRKKLPVKKDIPPTHLTSLKEEALSKPAGAENEEGKERPITSEAVQHFNLAVSFYSQRETLRAIQAYQKAIELNPAYIEAYNNLGIIYQELGDFSGAFETYQKAIEINPQYEKAYNNLGILLLFKGRLEEATEAFQKALTINPNNVECLINLGILFRKQGQSDKAVESYQKALAINPLRGETHYNIGLLYEEIENFELAVDHYQKFIQLSSKTYPVLASKVQSRVNYLLKVQNNKSK